MVPLQKMTVPTKEMTTVTDLVHPVTVCEWGDELDVSSAWTSVLLLVTSTVRMREIVRDFPWEFARAAPMDVLME